MSEIYVSTDVEVDGPIPGPHSMLSFASAAYSADHKLLCTFSANLEPLPGACAHPDTMAWWAKRPEAWRASREDQRPPAEAIASYVTWLDALPDKPVFVGYPAAFDFLFVYWYLIRFAGRSPFGFAALDMKTLAMVLMKSDYRAVAKKTMPRRWFGSARHTHVSLDDATEQGELFCNMLTEIRR